MDSNNNPVSEQNNNNTENGQKGAKYFTFKNILRLSLVIITGLSIYLFISTIIIVLLTKSDREVAVPHVIGKKFLNVYNSLVRKGLKPEVRIINTYDLDNGMILNQNPESGDVVSEGTTINLVVSKNGENITVPDLTGLKLPIALNKLQNLHSNDRSYSLSPGAISYMPSDKVKESVVIEHSPGADEEITANHRINFLVSAGNVDSVMKMPRVKGQYIDLCFDLLISKGIHIYEDINLTDSKRRSGKVTSQKPYAGEYIKKGNTIKLEIDYYAIKEHPYTAYERVTYMTPSDEKGGLYEVYIEDNKPKRLRYSKFVKPERKIDFIFNRKGNARVFILKDKKVVEIISIDVDNFN